MRVNRNVNQWYPYLTFQGNYTSQVNLINKSIKVTTCKRREKCCLLTSNLYENADVISLPIFMS